MDHSFIPGLELSRRFYHEAVRPLIHAHFGDLPHTAARIGTGAVFHDQLGGLTAARSRLTWYPEQTWRYILATAIATLHNQLGLTEPIDPNTRPYHDRPFQVLHAERFSKALHATITDPELRDLPLTGAVDQFADDPDLLGDHATTRTVTAVLTCR